MARSIPAPRRLLHRLAVLLTVVLMTGVAAATNAPASGDATLAAQRAAFRQAWNAASQQGGDGWRAFAGDLRDYPLYPYLPFAALQHDIRWATPAQVQAYLARYPDLIPAAELRREFLEELARRKDWQAFQAMYRPGINLTLSCDALQAKLAGGAPLDFDRDLAALWARPTLPSACDPVLQAAYAQGLLTPTRLWDRIDRALAAGQSGTIDLLSGWLPEAQAAVAQKMAMALDDPRDAAQAAIDWPDLPHLRAAVVVALQRLARPDPDTASAEWQRLRTHFDFSPGQRDDVLHALALYHAADFDPGSLAGLIALPPAAQNDATREWRVRVALSRQDWPAVLAAIEAMPPGQQEQDEWRYFRARALGELGHADAARPIYAALAKTATYFGFLAADRLGAPYAICPQQPPDDPQREQALLDRPGLRRAFELHAVDLPFYARLEWDRALDGADTTTRELAAELANHEGWYDRAVFTLNHGDLLHYYDLRFPLAPQYGMVAQAERVGIDPAWAYGILRAESAWMTDARSGADARGLMQLLPSAAAAVARRNGLPWGGGDTLYQPAVNITLGTLYLAQLNARFGQAPWLASAAYNAGAYRVSQWLDARGDLPPDVFVATIPYRETREYVQWVMAFSVIYDWRLHGSVLPMSARMPAYVAASDERPSSPLVRRMRVECPAAEATPAPPARTAAPAAPATPAPSTSRSATQR